MGDLLKLDDARKQIASMLFALDVHYDLGDGHPLLGRRMPDLDLEVDGETTRVYELLHDAKRRAPVPRHAERSPSTAPRGPTG